MTLSLKGFITDHSKVINTPGQIARFGELSTHCRTFSKDIQSLTSVAHPKVEVSVFSHLLMATKDQLAVSHVHADMLVEFSGWLYETAVAFTASTTQVDVVAAIANRFENYVTNVIVDKVVGNNGLFLPTRIQMKVEMDAMEPLEVVLWTANAEFETGYDETDITVVPPLDAIDTFMTSYSGVVEQLSVVNPVRDLQRIETAIDKKPPTHTVAITVTWIDPTQPSRTVATTWYALIYGSRGNTSDTINEALRDFILANSTAPEANWRIVMPDLFRVTRFLVIPMWTNAAIQGRMALPSIYSPVVSLKNIQDSALTITDGAGIIKSNCEVFNHPYRSLSLLMFAGEDNRENAKSLHQTIPDYIAVESIHEDFNRQSLMTQAFSNLIGGLIRAAENYTAGATMATGVRVVMFDSYTCLAAKHDNVEFVIRTKTQVHP